MKLRRTKKPVPFFGPPGKRSQDFLWECTFSSKKLTTTLPITPPTKNSAKNDYCSAWGTLKTFPCTLSPRNFFSALEVHVQCTQLHTLATPCLNVRGNLGRGTRWRR